MLSYSHKVSRYALVLFFLCIAGYAYYEARGIILGPKITIDSRAAEVSDPFIRIEGEAVHIDSITMNGAPISVTEQGDFSEPYLLAPGDNYVYFEAKDKYGHTTTKVVEIIYSRRAGATSMPAQADKKVPPAASSTKERAATAHNP